MTDGLRNEDGLAAGAGNGVLRNAAGRNDGQPDCRSAPAAGRFRVFAAPKRPERSERVNSVAGKNARNGTEGQGRFENLVLTFFQILG